jgi:uroporphyrinogen-III synthase
MRITMNGAQIGITAARRADEQAALVRSLGGVPQLGASVDIDHPVSDEVMGETLRGALASPLEIVVFVTGVGARHLLDAASRLGLEQALRQSLEAARVIVRGNKPRRVLREQMVPISWTALPAESRVIRDALLAEGVAGTRILVQCAGAAPDVMIGPLRGAGADVIEVHPYALDLPTDARGAVELAQAAAAGTLDALTFTSAHAVHGFVALAERAGVETEAIGVSGTLIVSVGPITRDALLEHGLPVHVEPETPRMGAMFHALATALGQRAPSLPDQ